MEQGPWRSEAREGHVGNSDRNSTPEIQMTCWPSSVDLIFPQTVSITIPRYIDSSAVSSTLGSRA